MDLLITVPGFGFGPASKAKAVARYLREESSDVTITYAGEGTAYTFGSRVEGVYDRVVDTTEISIADLLDSGDFDCLFTMLSSEATLEAKARDVPVATMDSLYFRWKWPNVDERLDEFESGLTRSRYEELTYHDKYLAAHYMADVSYLQWYPGLDRPDVDRERLGRVIETNPIVDRTRYTDRERDRVVVSMCGQLSLAVTEAEAVDYVETVVSALEPDLSTFEDEGYDVVVTGNPNVMAHVDLPFQTASLDHDEMLDHLNAAAALLCPPSLTSMFEAAVFGVPVFFLPEQHDNHWDHYEQVTKATDGEPCYRGLVLGEQFERFRNIAEKAASDDGFDADNVREVGAAIQGFIREQDPQEFRDQFDSTDHLRALADEDHRERVVEGQQAIILKDGTAEKSGARTIARDILDRFDAESAERDLLGTTE